MAIGAPCVFILFAPKSWVDLFLSSPNAPEILNPWIDLVTLYSASLILFFLLGRSFSMVRTWFVMRTKKGRERYYHDRV